MIRSLTDAIRLYLTGQGSRYEFLAADARKPRGTPASLDLYIHVPLCRHQCPYCPYYKVPYRQELAGPLVQALTAEIRMLRDAFPGVRAGSLYVGGGTPTLLGGELKEVVACVRNAFLPAGPIAIEVNPAEFDIDVAACLRSSGVNMISLGVQSFQDANLRFIGRLYGAKTADQSARHAVNAGFELVNIDLMFSLPGQTLANLDYDLNRAIDSGADQITLYPLFTFPYTAVGRLRQLRHVGMPSIPQRRRHYRHLHGKLTTAGWERVSVWSFTKPGRLQTRGRAYSSVTRDMYLGFGPGAATHLPGEFSFNTFSLDAYQRRLEQGRFATALAMPMTDVMERYYWLYWRLYQTSVPVAEMAERFEHDARAPGLLRWLGRFGMLRPDPGSWRLTERGAFWIHWAQNQFILPYIDTLWRSAMEVPFPRRVCL